MGMSSHKLSFKAIMTSPGPSVGDKKEHMSEKERFDAFIRLADIRLTRWNGRRDTEWRISLVFWGFLVAAAANRVPARLPGLFLAVVLLGLVVAYYFFFVRPIQWRNEDDQHEAFKFARKAEDVLEKQERTEEAAQEVREDQVRDPWAAVFQMATTVVIASYTWWSISGPTAGGQKSQAALAAVMHTPKGILDVLGLALATISAFFIWHASEETPWKIQSFGGATATEDAFRRKRTLQARTGFSLLGAGFALQLVSRFL